MNYNEKEQREKAKLYKTIRIILICIAISPIALGLLMIGMMILQTILENQRL